MTVKEKAHFVFRHRHLIVKRRENLTEAGARRPDPDAGVPARVGDACGGSPTGSTGCSTRPRTVHQASCRRAAIVRDPAFQAVPELVKAMEQLDEEKFAKLMAYLKNPVSRRVRTNNHVERTNRMFRFLEKVRYKWRRRRTLVRFVVLTLDAIWRQWTPAETKRTDPPKTARCGKTQSHDRQQSSRVA